MDAAPQESVEDGCQEKHPEAEREHCVEDSPASEQMVH